MSGKDAEIKQPSSESQNILHKLLASLAPVSGDCDRRRSPGSCYAGEALADVRVRVIGHCRERNSEGFFSIAVVCERAED